MDKHCFIVFKHRDLQRGTPSRVDIFVKHLRTVLLRKLSFFRWRRCKKYRKMKLKKQTVPQKCLRILRETLLYSLFRNQQAANAQTSLSSKTQTYFDYTRAFYLHFEQYNARTVYSTNQFKVHLIVSFLRESLTWHKYTRNATKTQRSGLMFKFCQKRRPMLLLIIINSESDLSRNLQRGTQSLQLANLPGINHSLEQQPL